MNIFNLVIVIMIICSVSPLAQEIDIYKRPVQVERSHNFDVLHYRLTMTFDLDLKEFRGDG
ncbi:hypothetical protein ACFLRX_00775 [Acidobacteriota bacterium]